ncbi:hypothetical protein Ga0074812_107114 [Parafrankia irregularis]|uniref:Uncharacterized protein n=1 Tax=Parafrankia irregularis TaxID=795642 RepID=A0A0S4QP00_9ACTN|nr:hypothetical protein Ga0074812_107114 [Parafrankia irregularis]
MSEIHVLARLCEWGVVQVFGYPEAGTSGPVGGLEAT